MALSELLPLVRQFPSYERVLAAFAGKRHPWIVGPLGPEKALVLAAVAQDLGIAETAPVVVITASQEAADRLHDDLLAFQPALASRLLALPPWESLPFDEGRPAAEIGGERLAILFRLLEGSPLWIIAPVAAILRKVIAAEELRAAAIHLAPKQRRSRDALIADLSAGGYERVELVESKGQFAVRGGLLDIYPPDETTPIRLEWFGDEVESITTFDPQTQLRTGPRDAVTVLPAAERPGEASLLDYLSSSTLLVLDEPADLRGQARLVLDHARDAFAAAHPGEDPSPFPFFEWDDLVGRMQRVNRVSLSALQAPEQTAEELPMRFGGVEAFGGQMRLMAKAIENWRVEGQRIVVATAQTHRIGEILKEYGQPLTMAPADMPIPAPGQVVAVSATLSRGFRIEHAGLVVISDAEILGWRRRRRRMRFREGIRVFAWTDLNPNDFVVHIHHGIGIYRGLVRLLLHGAERDYLHLDYAAGDRLYVPTDQLDLVQRYIGVEGQSPKIHRLGGAEWEREKKRVKEATQQVARELLELYAARETAPGHAFSEDTPWQHELEVSFEFEETPDQWLAIQDVKRDMERPRPMDRLIAGDVGYGKTEVALRAAFKAVMDGKQVAVLVPTTILAQQHYNVFLKRLAPYPIKVEMLSRFRTPADQRRIKGDLAAGTVDVIIGTHRLLQRDIAFRDLGLVIIDEEQRFGVVHKEKLKQLRRSVDVLTLTATPIPRTLHMSLVGLRDMSVMDTPPDARLPIHTEIRPYDDALIRAVILRELDRGGQVYVVHNRVESIERAARRLRSLVPEARVLVGHGQMPEERLEQVMMDFLAGRANVLVCTTIVEIGLDIPQVNTILIEDAHLMGLAQLYQLRGRVGRADQQAYCYLLYPRRAQLSPEARARLEAMQEFVELGSGYKLAMRDLEIRGAGNILGPEQHGQLAAVGFELYSRLLDEAVRELRGQPVEEAAEATIDLAIDAYLPESYVGDEGQRMAMYRKLATTRTIEEIDAAEQELADRFGPLPESATNLLEIARLRVLAREAGIATIRRDHDRVTIRPTGWTLTEEARAQLARVVGDRLSPTATGWQLRVAGTRFADDAALVRQTLQALKRFARRREPAITT